MNAVNVAPEVLNTRLLLATHYLRQNNYPKALQVIEKGLTIAPDSAVLYNLLSAVKFGQNRPDEAIEALHREGTPLPDAPDRRPARGVRSAAKRSPKKDEGRSDKKSKGVSGAKAAKEKRSGRPFRGFGRGRP